jgi:hypothetical protein
MSRTHLLSIPVLFASAVLAGCNSSDVVAPRPLDSGTFTVDARTGFVYISLDDSTVVNPGASAGSSPAWDIALFATNVTLNGGQAGPGGVTGYCVCQNTKTSPTSAQWLAQTAEGEAVDFDTLSAVPNDAIFTSDVLTPAFAGWYTGIGAAATANSDVLHFVRLSDSSGVAKVRVLALENPTATSAGRVRVEFAVASNGGNFGASQTVTLDVSTGAKSLDLQTGQVTTDASAWDLRIDGFTARVNGGISGNGKGGAAKVTTTNFADAVPTSTSANAFRIDSYAGVFGATPFYKYNLGGDNRITPTFDVYLLKRGSSVYKLQITNYYSPTGQARFISFRYAQIAQ